MIKDIHLPLGKKLFFASDFHLGEPDYQTTRAREAKIISWLDACEQEAGAFFFLGDVFDFWFEYRHVVPKGYTRLFGKLAALSDRGIPIYFFTGNHDMWLFDYLSDELNIPVYTQVQSFNVNQKRFLIGHGDGLGPGEHSYKLLKWVFSNPVCQWLFRWIHPNVGFAIANVWSRNSRKRNGLKQPFTVAEKEWLFLYCQQIESQKHHDYYVFGHRHLALELPINDSSVYFNLGEWIDKCTYGVFDGESFQIQSF